MFRCLTALLMACATFFVHPCAQAETTPGQKAVLVTGAGSGLGRVMAETMAAKGYFVYYIRNEFRKMVIRWSRQTGLRRVRFD